MKFTKNQFLLLLFAISFNLICIKMMLIPSYRSTDFDVHRNWLAITYSLPLKDWYFEKTSIWTLDYPPFFAYFEYILAQIVYYLKIDQEILKVENIDYASIQTIYFQRFSVIITDIIFYVSTFILLKHLYTSYNNDNSNNQSKNKNIKNNEKNNVCDILYLYVLTVANGGLLLVDHIHFQYNGLLMGLLLMCMIQVQTSSSSGDSSSNSSNSSSSSNSRGYYFLVICAASLFLMKHLFLPLGLVFVVYIIQNIHMDLKEADYYNNNNNDNSSSSSSSSSVRYISAWIWKLATLAFTGISIFLLALLPFYLSSSFFPESTTSTSIGQGVGVERNFVSILIQMASRLFPISRGLLHTYWAPNVWALYSFVDMITSRIIGSSSTTSLTNGITNEFIPGTLPIISSTLCILLVLLSLLLVLVPIIRSNRRCSGTTLIRLTLYSTLSTFMLGYHVHEKAIIPPAILSTILCYQSTVDASLCFHILLVCIHCQLPLLPYISEVHVKLLVAAVSFSLTWICCISKRNSNNNNNYGRIVRGVVLLLHILVILMRDVIYPCCVNGMFGEVISNYANHYQFLPLLITSVFNACCLLPCWYESYQSAISNELVDVEKKR